VGLQAPPRYSTTVLQRRRCSAAAAVPQRKRCSAATAVPQRCATAPPCYSTSMAPNKTKAADAAAPPPKRLKRTGEEGNGAINAALVAAAAPAAANATPPTDTAAASQQPTPLPDTAGSSQLLSAPVEAALNRIAPVVEKTITNYNRTKAVVEAFERVRDACAPETNLRWSATAQCNQVATHPDNRGRSGLVVRKCFLLGSKHLKTGYSYTRASAGAVAQSFPRDPALQRWIEDVNVEHSKTQPELPLLSSPQVVALGATHSNGWLRLVKGGAACSLDDVAPNGYLIEKELIVGRKGFEKACGVGLTWDVYEYGLFQRWPVLTEVFSQAANYKGTQEIGEIEGLLTIGRAADEFTSKGVPVDWESALETGIQSDPFWKGWAPALVDLCKVLPTEAFVELTEMLKATSKKDLSDMAHYGQPFIQALAEFKLGKDIRALRVPVAMLLLQAFSPVECIDSGKFCLLNGNDITKIKSKKLLAATIQAEKCLEEARSLLTSSGVAAATRYKMLAGLDLRMASHLVQKGHKSHLGKHFSSFKAVLHEWVDEVNATGVSLVNPWNEVTEYTYEISDMRLKAAKADGKDEKAEAIQAASAATRMSAAAMKDPGLALAAKGFPVGTLLRQKLTKEEKDIEDFPPYPIMRLVSVSANGMTTLKTEILENGDEEETKFVETTDLPAQYAKASKPKLQVEFEWQGARPKDHAAWGLDILKGAVSTALFLLHKECDDAFAKRIGIKLNPTMVYATEACNKDSLVISPGTTHVTIRRLDTPCPPKGVDLGKFKLLTTGEPTHVLVHLMPQAINANVEKGKGFNNPYWIVRKLNDDEDEVPNMVMGTKTVTMPIGTGIQSYKVVFPVMLNSKKIAAGKELILI